MITPSNHAVFRASAVRYASIMEDANGENHCPNHMRGIIFKSYAKSSGLSARSYHRISQLHNYFLVSWALLLCAEFDGLAFGILSTTQTVLGHTWTPSSRPESDFTLDLPRAEQLRIKMEKEKKFRQRCRYITTFLSLVFFLLTVMVVSLVLTRGKRMFGSMI